jgi:hypothetical protein
MKVYCETELLRGRSSSVALLPACPGGALNVRPWGGTLETPIKTSYPFGSSFATIAASALGRMSIAKGPHQPILTICVGGAGIVQEHY